MKTKIVFQILLLFLLYVLCIYFWNAEQAIGIGRPFVYSVF
jgi:hypothetical protein